MTLPGSLPPHLFLLIAAAGVYAGAQNALAGGGSFITFPALLLAGLDPLSANMTSTIALFPSQLTAAVASRQLVEKVGPLSYRRMFFISLAGGLAGALLLVFTPVATFSRLLPWLVLFATAMYAWGSFRRRPLFAASGMPLPLLVLVQTAIAIYGGYFGGGIGFLMLAALTMAGQQVRAAAATKNGLAMAMNASAVAIFAFSGKVDWLAMLALACGGIAGGYAGAWLIRRLPEKLMRGLVVVVGVALTVWMFLRR
jgi:uncharacterized membrane protein YfcA